MNIKTISKIIISAQIISLQGCNNAGGNSTENSEPQVNQVELSQGPLGYSKKQLEQLSIEQDVTGFIKLPRVELGWGYDPRTDTVRPVPGIAVGKLLDTDGSSVVFQEPNQLTDYAKYQSGSTSDSSKEDTSFGGGIGASYGLYNASLKAAKASLSQSAKGELKISKQVGLVYSTETHFPLDPKKLSRVQSAAVGNAIYNAASNRFKQALDNIRQAKNSFDRNQRVKEFYDAFGSDFIYSKNQGGVGFVNIDLTQKASQGSDASKLEAGFSFSSPFVKGEANFSQGNATTFNKDNWDYSLNSFVSPNDPNVKSTLDKMLATMKTDLDAAMSKGALNLDKLKDYQTQTEKELKLPSLDSIKVTPDPELQKKLESQASDYTSMKDSLSDLGDIYEGVINIMKKRDEVSDLKEKEKYQASIKGQISDNSAYKKLIDKLNIDKRKLTFTSENSANLSKYINLYNKLIVDSETKYQDFLFQANETEIALARQKKIEKDKPSFANWLKTTAFEQDKGDNTSYETWYDGLTITQIGSYGKSYLDYLEKNEYIGKDRQQENIANKIFTQKESQVAPNAAESNPNVFVTLNYGIMPWATLYPELNSSEEFYSGPTEIIYQKIMQKLAHIIDTRNYLLLCANQLNDVELNKIYSEDSNSKNLKAIQSALDNFDFTSTTVKFFGDEYSLDNLDSIKGLEKTIDDSINSLSMAKSNWYKAAEYLYSKELIAPQGVALGVTSETYDTKTSVPIRGLISNEPSYIAYEGYDLYRLSSVPLSFTLGQQIASIIGGKNDYKVFTGEVLVGSLSKIVKNQPINTYNQTEYVTNVKLLFSSPVPGPNFTKVLITPDSFSIGTEKGRETETIFYKSNGFIPFLRMERNYREADNCWKIDNSSFAKGSYSFVFSPLNNFNLETLKTAFGGNEKAQELAPQFKLFYNSTENLINELFSK